MEKNFHNGTEQNFFNIHKAFRWNNKEDIFLCSYSTYFNSFNSKFCKLLSGISKVRQPLEFTP